jgi:hypothetical protein
MNEKIIIATYAGSDTRFKLLINFFPLIGVGKNTQVCYITVYIIF